MDGRRPDSADCGRKWPVAVDEGRIPELRNSTSLRRDYTRALGAGRALAVTRPTCAKGTSVSGAQTPIRTAVWVASHDSFRLRQSPYDDSGAMLMIILDVVTNSNSHFVLLRQTRCGI